MDVGSLKLREATNEDRPRIRMLVTSILAEYGRPLDLDTSDADLVDIEASYKATGGFLLIAEAADGKLVGSVGIVGRDPHNAKLRKMYVSREHRGLGVGRFLLQEALSRAARLGFKSITLETMNTMHAAMHLYESVGFRRIESDLESPRCHHAYRLDL